MFSTWKSVALWVQSLSCISFNWDGACWDTGGCRPPRIQSQIHVDDNQKFVSFGRAGPSGECRYPVNIYIKMVTFISIMFGIRIRITFSIAVLVCRNDWLRCCLRAPCACNDAAACTCGSEKDVAPNGAVRYGSVWRDEKRWKKLVFSWQELNLGCQNCWNQGR